ncbi:MAG: HisA/HisF-related TIM barrel protein [Candidatus Helarchaeota archaeon]
MRIIPVLDILQKNVVHGKKGERNKYIPIESVICSNAEPLNVAMAFKNQFNFNEIYVADLDSIINGKKEFDYVNEIFKKTRMKIIIDAGISTPEAAALLFKKRAAVVIIATETLNSFNQLKEIVEKFGPEKIITSIDLYEGKIMAKGEGIKNLTPVEVAIKISKMGIVESIILELTRVGSNKGVALSNIQNIQRKTNLKIITGGGVKSAKDLLELEKLDLSGLLIATAFHNGSIKPEDIANFENLKIRK